MRDSKREKRGLIKDEMYRFFQKSRDRKERFQEYRERKEKIY